MITTAALRRTDNLVLRWLPTGREHAYPNPRSRNPNSLATPTFDNGRSQKAKPPLPVARVINCLEAPSAPVLASSASAP
jgi:hypothetical protein